MTHFNRVNRFIGSPAAVGTVTDKTLTAPSFIREPEDANSLQHMRNCMAWWLVKTKTHTQIEVFCQSQSTANREALREPLIRCYAWVWLLTLPPTEIRHRLRKVSHEQQDLYRFYLNQYREQTEKEINNAN